METGEFKSKYFWPQILVYIFCDNLQTQQFFKELENIGDLAESWGDYSPQLFDFLNNSRTIDALRVSTSTASVFIWVGGMNAYFLTVYS